MLKTFGTISLIGIVVAIAGAGSYVTPASFLQVGTAVVSGVLAHAFVASAERTEEAVTITRARCPTPPGSWEMHFASRWVRPCSRSRR